MLNTLCIPAPITNQREDELIRVKESYSAYATQWKHPLEISVQRGLPGENRNAFLLNHAGKKLFMADTDTLCIPRAKSGAVFGPLVEGVSVQTWEFFPNRTSALASGEPVETDILTLHDEALDYATVSLNGCRGDSAGWRTPTPGMGAEIAKALTKGSPSREVSRQVLSPTFSHEHFVISMFMGLNNQTLVPPFPEGQITKEDMIWAKLFYMCDPEFKVAHLPFTLGHDPIGLRTFHSGRKDAILLCTYIAGILGYHRPVGETPADRFRNVGQYLVDISQLPSENLLRGLRRIWLAKMSATKTTPGDTAGMIPVDLDERTPNRWLDAFRAYVGNYGKLLLSWPEEWEAARKRNS